MRKPPGAWTPWMEQEWERARSQAEDHGKRVRELHPANAAHAAHSLVRAAEARAERDVYERLALHLFYGIFGHAAKPRRVSVSQKQLVAVRAALRKAKAPDA